MPKRRLYREDLRKVVVSATAEYCEGREVPSGSILFVTFSSLEDEDNNADTLSFGRYQGERFEALEEHEDPIAGIRYSTKKTHVFVAGEKPVWRIEGATADDTMKGFAEGYYEDA